MKKGAVSAVFFLILLFSVIYPCFSADWIQLDDEQAMAQMARISETLGEIKTMSVDFTQERSLSLFNDKLVSRGRCLFEKPSSLRWEYTEPFQSLLLYSNGRAAKYELQQNRFKKVNQAGGDMIAMVMEEILFWIQGDFTRSREMYSIVLMERSGVIRFIHTPNSSELRDVISQITLDFDKKSSMTLAVSLVDGMGDSTSIIYSGQRNNVSLPSDSFNLKAPAVME